MKNQINFLFKKKISTSPTKQLLNNIFKIKVTSPDKPNGLIGFNLNKSSTTFFKKIYTMCSELYKVKGKYTQEKQSRNYWNSIN